MSSSPRRPRPRSTSLPASASLGLILRLARILRFQTLSDVARESGVPASTIAAIESGGRNLTETTARKLVKAFR